MGTLDGRHALITGGGTGIGASVATHLHAAGAKISVLGRRIEPLRHIASITQGAAIQCDVTDMESCTAAIGAAAEQMGGIDALVYATGIGTLARIEDLTTEQWRSLFDTNVIGAAHTTAAALPHLKASSGSAAYLSSVAGNFTPPWPGLGGYAVSKAALDQLVEAWRAEHPEIGFTRVIVGDCAGGEGDAMTQFANDWDTEYAAEVLPSWMTRGYMNGGLVDVGELLRVIDTVIQNRAIIPSVTVTPRAPG